MCAKARLAASEFDKDKNISVRKSVAFPGSTLHGHDFYELDIVISGNVKTVLNGKESRIGRGSLFFMSPADFHEYACESNFDLYNVQFTNEAISSQILEQITGIGVNTFTPDSERFNQICQLVSVMHSIKDNEYCEQVLSRILESILLILIQGQRGTPESAHFSNTPDVNIQRAMMYIHAHFKENPSLSEVAEAVHLNPHYFCTKFREYTGKNYKQYLRGVKLRYAKRLIIATSLPMITVAENSGYTAQSHFNREFKEHYGLSPLAMRKNRL